MIRTSLQRKTPLRRGVTWRISTGKQVWREKGEDAYAATVAAFKRRPPKRAGLLTMAHDLRKPEDGPETVYMMTTRLLRDAGHTVPPIPYAGLKL